MADFPVVASDSGSPRLGTQLVKLIPKQPLSFVWYPLLFLLFVFEAEERGSWRGGGAALSSMDTKRQKMHEIIAAETNS